MHTPLTCDRLMMIVNKAAGNSLLSNALCDLISHCRLCFTPLRPTFNPQLGRGCMCEKFLQLLAVGRWFPPGTPVSSTRKLISSSSFHRLDMTLAVAEVLNPNKPNLIVVSFNLSLQLLRFNPTERLGSGINGAEDVKHHPFFHGINWNLLQGWGFSHGCHGSQQ